MSQNQQTKTITRVTDSSGRVLGVRAPGPLQRLRLFEAVGPENCENKLYLGVAGLAGSVAEIDGEPCDPITTKRQLEARVLQLDDHGLLAVGQALTTIAAASEVVPNSVPEGAG